MWQFYAFMVSALFGSVYLAWSCKRYVIFINYGTTCHLELDPIIKDKSDIEESIRRSEIEGFYEEQIAEGRKRKEDEGEKKL